MYYAININNFGDCGDARALAGLARDAEDVGWDGFFIWDHIAWDWGAMPMVDATVALAAIAMSTERIRIGAMVTPLPRRRPWKVAREMVSLDHLSGGRLIMGVGLGVTQAEYANLGEPADFKTRAAMLDEGLAVLERLWSGEPFGYDGEYYRVRDTQFLPTPLQQPRIPIWVAGMWPNKPPFRRAARWDGVFPILRDAGLDNIPSPEQLREIVAFVQEQRQSDAPFDVVVAGSTPGDDAQRAEGITVDYAAAGATWWQEGIHGLRDDLAARAEASSWLDAMRWRILQGPPRP
jgi:alkanesulfonate monooxygenase SsuD/methylene tetrahydromethanopterin reductase-like flavin-dependent oxidoreductase (luciferase family)